MGRAVHTTPSAGMNQPTLEQAGRGTITAEGKVHDENRELMAHATTTCVILTPLS